MGEQCRWRVYLVFDILADWLRLLDDIFIAENKISQLRWRFLVPFWFACFSWWLWFRLQVKKHEKYPIFLRFILDINYIQFWKWKVFLADLIFFLKFSVVFLHLGYSSLAVYPCRVVFVLILLSSSIFSASSALPKNSKPPRCASPFRSIDTCRQTSYVGQQKELVVKNKLG